MDNNYNLFDTNNRVGKFLDEYQTNVIISSNTPEERFKDGVDYYYSLNDYLDADKKEKPNYMN